MKYIASKIYIKFAEYAGHGAAALTPGLTSALTMAARASAPDGIGADHDLGVPFARR